uniref:Secreted protein n=1 Tax=Mus spicilegus TaxID=10103 RepID=A0A8C6HNS1_MUSSI
MKPVPQPHPGPVLLLLLATASGYKQVQITTWRATLKRICNVIHSIYMFLEVMLDLLGENDRFCQYNGSEESKPFPC